MIYHIVYDKESGEIIHVHSVFDAAAGAFIREGERQVLETLADFIPEPDKAAVLHVSTAAPVTLHRMKVNPADKRLVRDDRDSMR